jgi:hypothetical protein
MADPRRVKEEIMTDGEVLKWVSQEMRSRDKKRRYKAWVIFNKRFPNPDYCHCCGRKTNDIQ